MEEKLYAYTRVGYAAKVSADSALVSRNITINGRRTSVRLEPEMWDALRQISHEEGLTIHQLCSIIHGNKNSDASFTATLRVFLMAYYRYAQPAAVREPEEAYRAVA